MVAFVASAFLSTAVMAEEIGYDEELVMYDVAQEKSELGEDFDILGGRFRCELIVIIVDRGNNNRRQRHSFFGDGRSFEQSRGFAFSNYNRFINRGQFWRGRFNHSFAYNNCQNGRGRGY